MQRGILFSREYVFICEKDLKNNIKITRQHLLQTTNKSKDIYSEFI